MLIYHFTYPICLIASDGFLIRHKLQIHAVASIAKVFQLTIILGRYLLSSNKRWLFAIAAIQSNEK